MVSVRGSRGGFARVQTGGEFGSQSELPCAKDQESSGVQVCNGDTVSPKVPRPDYLAINPTSTVYIPTERGLRLHGFIDLKQVCNQAD